MRSKLSLEFEFEFEFGELRSSYVTLPSSSFFVVSVHFNLFIMAPTFAICSREEILFIFCCAQLYCVWATLIRDDKSSSWCLMRRRPENRLKEINLPRTNETNLQVVNFIRHWNLLLSWHNNTQIEFMNRIGLDWIRFMNWIVATRCLSIDSLFPLILPLFSLVFVCKRNM